ncbi:ATP-grasp domain-containing protein [Streptomyces sp. MUM 178J]|uniref:ATP-grasp domain-containing protein n=1 Tax=Streptomyces sp. MUM 178J TaxID=2791991 RepID=UPI001F04AA8F|nr:hypothetical protein [Streptomyces sp. MUM 178J]WRQ82477.1 hypothetical protein I3F59_025710 [Streptomyces sp. MUM 178J]
MKKIIILGVNAVSLKYLPQALRTAGYEPVFLLDPADFSAQSAAALRGSACFPVDIEDRAAVLRLLAEHPAITEDAFAITGLFDEKFPLIEELAAAYGLCRPDPAAARLASKAEVARIIPEHCPPTARFTAAEARRSAVDPAAVTPAPHGYILKPAEQAGGQGVVQLPPDATSGTVRDAVAASGMPDDDGYPWVLQADVRGQLISLEGYVEEGRVVFIGFSLRGRIAWTEISNLLPADDRLSPAVRDRCRAAVTALAERSGMTQGYFHSEFLVPGDPTGSAGSGDQAFLIDANAGRLGGGGHVEQLALAYALDPAEILAHVVTLGLPDVPTSPAPAYGSAAAPRSTTAYYYGLEREAVVTSVSVPPGGRCLHTQVVRDGGRVDAAGTGDSAWVGVLTGPTEDIRREMEGIVVHTVAGPRRPAWTPTS